MSVSIDFLDKMYSLIDSIKKTDEYINLQKTVNLINSDDHLSSIIKSFNDKKELLNDNPNDKKILSELSIIKKELYTSILYLKYDEALKEYNKMISLIEDSINKAFYSETINSLIKGENHDKKN